MKSFNFAVLALFALAFFGMSQSASAWWGHFGGPVWGPRFAYPAYGYYGYGYYGYGWADACCAPVVDACCAPAAPVAAAPVVADCATCGPVCDTCGPVIGYSGGYYLGWRPGPIRRLLFGRYRWYASGYWGGYYYAPDCCAPTYNTLQEVPSQPAPAPANQAPAAPAPSLPSSPSVIQPPAGDVSILTDNVYHQTSFTQKEATQDNSGIVTIYVPEDAVVYVNDARTTTLGSARSFVSFGLMSGSEYDYVIRAEVVRGGQTFVETKVVTLKAGDKEAVTFAFPQIANPVEQVVAL